MLCSVVQFHYPLWPFFLFLTLKGQPHIIQAPAVTPRAKKYLSSIIWSYKWRLPPHSPFHQDSQEFISICRCPEWKISLSHLHCFMTMCLLVPFLIRFFFFRRQVWVCHWHHCLGKKGHPWLGGAWLSSKLFRGHGTIMQLLPFVRCNEQFVEAWVSRKKDKTLSENLEIYMFLCQWDSNYVSYSFHRYPRAYSIG